MNNTINLLERINKTNRFKNFILLLLSFLSLCFIALSIYLYFFRGKETVVQEVLVEKECSVEQDNEDTPEEKENVFSITDDKIVLELYNKFTESSLYYYSDFLGLEELHVTEDKVDERAKLLIAYNEIKDFYAEEIQCKELKNKGNDGLYKCGPNGITHLIKEDYLLGVVKRFFGDTKLSGMNFNISFGSRFKYDSEKKSYFYQEQQTEDGAIVWKPSPKLVDYDYEKGQLEMVVYFDISSKKQNDMLIYEHDDAGYNYYFTFKKDDKGLYVFDSLKKIKNE